MYKLVKEQTYEDNRTTPLSILKQMQTYESMPGDLYVKVLNVHAKYMFLDSP